MGHQASILIVDDEQGMLNSLVAILEDEGHRVYGCSNGSDAIKVLSSAPSGPPIDLVISDLNLPDITGLTILFHLKKVQPDAAFILITAHATLETALEAVNQGAFAYHVKPLDMDSLIQTVHNAIMQQRLIIENRQLLEEVQRSEMKYRTLVEKAGDGIYMVEPETERIVEVNPALTTLTGLSKEDLLGSRLSSLESDVEARRIGHLIDQTLQFGQATATDLSFRKPGGEQVIVDLNSSLMECQESKYLLGIARDTTERKAAEDALREKSRLASIGQLAAGVAHEINNPLAVIAGYSELMLLLDLPEALYDKLKTINSESRRAGKIVHDLLTFARPQQPRKQDMPITTILEQAMTLKSSYLAVNGISVNCQWEKDLPAVMLDDQQILEVLLNLISNAEQALAPLTGYKELNVQAQRLGNCLRVSVSDNGPGIAAEHFDKIFDPFFTTKDIGQGTGLGLSICYGIVRQHNGTIWAESSAGNGTTFHVELPLAQATDQPVGVEAEGFKVSDSLGRALIVDDESGIRSFVSQLLGDYFDVVDQAEDGEVAWEMVQVNHYDCILLDFKMPRMCGQDFYKLLKEADSSQADRVIFVTGDTVSEETRSFLTESGSPFVSKPFSISELLQVINLSSGKVRAAV